MPITPEQQKKADEVYRKMKENETPILKVKVDDNEAYTHLQEEFRKIKTEKEDLEAKLTIAAEMEFNRRKADVETKAKQLGLSVDLETPEDLRATEKIIRENSGHTGNRDIPLNSAQLGIKPRKQFSGSVTNREYESYAEMIQDLDSEAQQGNPEAKNVLKKLAQKSVKDLQQGSVFEFKGKLIPEKEWKDQFSYVEKDPNNKNKWEKV